MLPQTERELFSRSATPKRFDAEDAKQILDRAVAEQTRRERELAGSYSLEELEEIAAEAGISKEALRAAIEQRPGRRRDTQRTAGKTSSRMPRGAVLAGIAGVVLVALLILVPEMAYAIVVALIVLVTILMFAG